MRTRDVRNLFGIVQDTRGFRAGLTGVAVRPSGISCTVV